MSCVRKRSCAARAPGGSNLGNSILESMSGMWGVMTAMMDEMVEKVGVVCARSHYYNR